MELSIRLLSSGNPPPPPHPALKSGHPAAFRPCFSLSPPTVRLPLCLLVCLSARHLFRAPPGRDGIWPATLEQLVQRLEEDGQRAVREALLLESAQGGHVDVPGGRIKGWCT
jgi:hypothetical protein